MNQYSYSIPNLISGAGKKICTGSGVRNVISVFVSFIKFFNIFYSPFEYY